MRADEKVLAPSELDAYRRYALENAGDPLHGYQVFRQPSGPMCARCHAVFGEGGKGRTRALGRREEVPAGRDLELRADALGAHTSRATAR
jgi:hypothetical protein